MNGPTSVTDTLDRLERDLPALPATWIRVNRAVVNAGTAQVTRLTSTVNTSVANLLAVGRTSSKTVVGQARAAGDQVLKTAFTGTRQVTGQARAQGRRVADVAGTEAAQVSSKVRRQANDVAVAVEDTANETVKAAEQSTRRAAAAAERNANNASTKAPKSSKMSRSAGAASTSTTSGSGRGYESWSKGDLYARAQELDIEGRTSMSKRQLVAALRDN